MKGQPAPAGLGHTRRKYFTRDMLPLEYGAKVRLTRKDAASLKKHIGTVIGYRTTQDGNSQEWEYRVRLWRTNQWWFKASDLEIVSEPAPIKPKEKIITITVKVREL